MRCFNSLMKESLMSNYIFNTLRLLANTETVALKRVREMIEDALDYPESDPFGVPHYINRTLLAYVNAELARRI